MTFRNSLPRSGSIFKTLAIMVPKSLLGDTNNFFLLSSARQYRNCIRIGHQKSSKHHMCKQSLTMSLLKVLDHNNGIMTFLFIHRRHQQFFLVSSAPQYRNCIRIGHQKSSKHHMCKQSLTMSSLKVLDHNNGIMTFLFIDFLFFFRDRLRY